MNNEELLRQRLELICRIKLNHELVRQGVILFGKLFGDKFKKQHEELKRILAKSEKLKRRYE